LFYVNRKIADRATVATLEWVPVKYLAGIQGHREIEIGNADLGESHEEWFAGD
jgi:hypothetical protein